MKKLVSLLLALCLAAMMIPAFAEEDLTGVWYGNMMGMGVTITLNEDGTFEMAAGGNVMASGTWKVEDGKLLLDVEGDTEEFEINDGTLYNAASDMTLSRNPEDAPAAIEVAEVKPDAAAEEFYGDWVCLAVEVQGMRLDAAAYAEKAEDELPGLTVSADAVSFTGDGMITMLFSMVTLNPVYADGAIVASPAVEDMPISVRFEMLQDGNLKATLESSSDPMILYYAPAAAEEAPAA